MTGYIIVVALAAFYAGATFGYVVGLWARSRRSQDEARPAREQQYPPPDWPPYLSASPWPPSRPIGEGAGPREDGERA